MPLFPERRVPARRIDVADLLRYDKSQPKLPSKDELDAGPKAPSLSEQKRAAAEPPKALPKGGPGGRPDPQHSLSAAAGTAADAARIPGRVVGAIADKLPKTQLPGIVGALAGYDDLGASSQNAPQMIQQAPKTTPGDLLRGAVDMFAPGDTSEDATPASQAAAIGLGMIPGGKLLGKGVKAAWKGISRLPVARQLIGNRLDNAIAAAAHKSGQFESVAQSRAARKHLDTIVEHEAKLAGKEFSSYDDFANHVAQKIADLEVARGAPPSEWNRKAARHIVSQVGGSGKNHVDLEQMVKSAAANPGAPEFSGRLSKPTWMDDLWKAGIAHKVAGGAASVGGLGLGVGGYQAGKAYLNLPGENEGPGIGNPFQGPWHMFSERFGEEADPSLRKDDAGPKADAGPNGAVAPPKPAIPKDENGRIILPPDVGVNGRRAPGGAPLGIDQFGMPNEKVQVREADSVTDPGAKRLMADPREFFHMRSEYRRLRGVAARIKQRGGDLKENMDDIDYQRWLNLSGDRFKNKNGFSIFEGG